MVLLRCILRQQTGSIRVRLASSTSRMEPSADVARSASANNSKSELLAQPTSATANICTSSSSELIEHSTTLVSFAKQTPRVSSSFAHYSLPTKQYGAKRANILGRNWADCAGARCSVFEQRTSLRNKESERELFGVTHTHKSSLVCDYRMCCCLCLFCCLSRISFCFCCCCCCC